MLIGCYIITLCNNITLISQENINEYRKQYISKIKRSWN